MSMRKAAGARRGRSGDAGWRVWAGRHVWRGSLALLAAATLGLPFLHAQLAAVLFLAALLIVFVQVVFRSTAEEGRRPL